VVGDLSGAVVGNIAYCYTTSGEGDAVETIVADAHTDDDFQVREQFNIVLSHSKLQEHDAVDAIPYGLWNG